MTGEKGIATHSRILAWRIPRTEEPGGLQFMESQSQTRLSDFPFTFHFHALEKEMATHSSVLAWRIPGTGEPGELQFMESQSQTWLKWLSTTRSNRCYELSKRGQWAKYRLMVGSLVGGAQGWLLQGCDICLNDGQDLNEEKRQPCTNLGKTEATARAKDLRQEWDCRVQGQERGQRGQSLENKGTWEGMG